MGWGALRLGQVMPFPGKEAILGVKFYSGTKIGAGMDRQEWTRRRWAGTGTGGQGRDRTGTTGWTGRGDRVSQGWRGQGDKDGTGRNGQGGNG